MEVQGESERLMHPELPSKEDLLKLLSQEQFLKQIVDQLNKDLGATDLIRIPEEGDQSALIKASLRDHLVLLDRAPGNRLQDLMYRVDVPSNQFHRILAASAHEDLYDLLSDAILNREMQKVWFRLNYKG